MKNLFLKNAWYCAGWDKDLGIGLDDLLARKIAGQSLLLFRKPNGEAVAMEDRCPHRNAPLSLGRKEGDGIRCLYHGVAYGSDGNCTEIPGMKVIPKNACVKTFPVVEKNNWVWVWMGNSDQVDESLICDAYSLDDSNLKLKTHTIQVNTNYREEIANLADLSHISWVHENTFGGGKVDGDTASWSLFKPINTMTPRGIEQQYIVRGASAPIFVKHLFPEGTKFDIRSTVRMSLPCNFVLHFEIFKANEAINGPPLGELVLDTYSSQAVTPRDDSSVDYYFSWGTSLKTYNPRIVDLMHETNYKAFIEDKRILEGQRQRMLEYPDAATFNIAHDAGSVKLLWLLNKLLDEERLALET